MLLSCSGLILVKSRFIINAERKSSLMTLGTCQSILRSVWVVRDVWVIKRLLCEGPLPTLGKGSWQDGLCHVACWSLPAWCLLEEPPPSFPFNLSHCFSDTFFSFPAQKPQKLRHYKMQCDIIDTVTFQAHQDFGFFFQMSCYPSACANWAYIPIWHLLSGGKCFNSSVEYSK